MFILYVLQSVHNSHVLNALCLMYVCLEIWGCQHLSYACRCDLLYVNCRPEDGLNVGRNMSYALKTNSGINNQLCRRQLHNNLQPRKRGNFLEQNLEIINWEFMLFLLWLRAVWYVLTYRRTILPLQLMLSVFTSTSSERTVTAYQTTRCRNTILIFTALMTSNLHRICTFTNKYDICCSY